MGHWGRSALTGREVEVSGTLCSSEMALRQ